MEELPSEIILTIISYLSDSAQRQLRLANTKWFNLIDYGDFTVYLTKKSEWPELVNRLERYAKPISLRLATQIMEDTEYLCVLTRLTNLVNFSVDGDSITFYNPLTILTNLQTLNGFKDIPLELYLSFTRLKSINYIHMNDFNNPKIADAFTKLSDLEQLSISAYHKEEDETKYSASNKFTVGLHKKLTRLVLDYGGQFDTVNDNNCKIMENLLEFDSIKQLSYNGTRLVSLKHMTALEHLSSDSFADLNSSSLTYLYLSGPMPEWLLGAKSHFLVNLKNLSVNGDASMEYLTALTNLISLSLNFPKQNDTGAEITSLRNITSTKLQKLKFQNLKNDGVDLGPISRITTLQDISFFFCSDYFVIGNLKYLTSLSVYHTGSNNNWTISQFQRLTRLQKLHYKCLDAHQITINLSLLSHLEELDLQFKAGNVFGLANLSKVTKMQILCQQPQFNPLGLEQLTNLQYLGCHFCPESFDFLTGLVKLKSLAVWRTSSNEPDNLAFFTGLSQLTRLSLEMKVVDPIYLTGLTSLKCLDWSYATQTFCDTLKAALPNLVSCRSYEEVLRN